MVPTKKVCIWLAALALMGGLILAAGPGMAADPETFPCAEKVEKQIAAEAELTGLVCHMGKFDGVDSLFVKVTLKNVCKKDRRFRVQMFFDEGKAVGGLIPRTTKKGLIKPGEEASFTYPVKGLAAKPKEMTIIVKTMSD